MESELAGISKFLGNLFKMTVRTCSFMKFELRQGSWKCRATFSKFLYSQLDYGSFHYQARRYGREMKVYVFGTGIKPTTGRTNGLKNGVVMVLDLTELDGIGGLDMQTPDWVRDTFRSSLGLVTVLPGRVLNSEVEAGLLAVAKT
ncbi:hypothetical protein Tco_0004936 [Tanacetum coccineum]